MDDDKYFPVIYVSRTTDTTLKDHKISFYNLRSTINYNIREYTFFARVRISFEDQDISYIIKKRGKHEQNNNSG